MPKIPVSYILIAVYILLILALQRVIPTSDKLLEILKNLYGTYGYAIIFLGAFLEAMFVVSLYVPGSTAILLGAALSRTGVIQFPIVLVVSIVGLLLGYTLNYFLGRDGWYHVLSRMGLQKGLDVAKTKLHEHQVKTILLGYFHPSGASFLSTAAGVLKIPFQRFFLLSFISQTFWGILWGSLAYSFGMPLVEFFIRYFSFIMIGIVAVWWIRKSFKKPTL